MENDRTTVITIVRSRENFGWPRKTSTYSRTGNDGDEPAHTSKSARGLAGPTIPHHYAFHPFLLNTGIRATQQPTPLLAPLVAPKLFLCSWSGFLLPIRWITLWDYEVLVSIKFLHECPVQLAFGLRAPSLA
jgi:hypothetical protein